MFEQKIGGVKMKNQKGFTLVELLVVIAIIGILSSVAVINLNGARDKAKSANVQATLAQLSTAFVICGDADGNIVPPSTNNGTGNVCAPVSAINVTWPDIGVQGFMYNAANLNTPTNVGNNINTATGWKLIAVNGGAGDTVKVNCSEAGCAIQ